MSDENKTQDIAAELAALKAQADAAAKRAEAAEQKSAEAQSYMESIKEVASGGKPQPQPKAPHEVFVDQVLTQGDAPVRNLVQEELQKKAYWDTLQSNFQKENPHLEPMKDEVFSMANAIVHRASTTGQPVNWESALKAASDHYNDKHKRLLKISGANASPGGYSGMPNSRYAGCETDYFAMSDQEFFEKEMKPRDDARKRRNREGLSHYGYGR